MHVHRLAKNELTESLDEQIETLASHVRDRGIVLTAMAEEQGVSVSSRYWP